MEISKGVICRGRNTFLDSIIADYSSTKMLIKKQIMKKSAVFKLEFFSSYTALLFIIYFLMNILVTSIFLSAVDIISYL